MSSSSESDITNRFFLGLVASLVAAGCFPAGFLPKKLLISMLWPVIAGVIHIYQEESK